MERALALAKKAGEIGEVPVASIIISSKTKEIISSSHNMVELSKNSILHSEIIAISEACKKLGTKYLDECEIYVTLEPCIMCYTAISYAKINSLYFGAYDNKKSFQYLPPYLYKPQIYGGIMEKESEELLSQFFNRIRSK